MAVDRATRGRAPTLADVPALAAFIGACYAADGRMSPTADEIEEWLTDPSFDIENNFRMWTVAGELVAYSDLALFVECVWLELDIRPDLRGGPLEDELLQWNIERAHAFAPGRRLRRILFAEDERGVAASARAGFAPVRYSNRMRIELAAPPAPPDPPAGVELRSFRPGDERAIWRVHQDSFRDAWGHVEMPYEEWHQDRIAPRSFDPALWVVADAGGEIAGVSLCRFLSGHGWVGVVGVLRPWRRRGLGGALLRESFRRFWERGERIVELGVDADSPTGAVRLYEREGMHVDHRAVTLEREP